MMLPRLTALWPLALLAACASPSGGDTGQLAATVGLDPQVEQVMRTLCDRVANTPAMSFRLVDHTDEIEGGVKVTTTHTRDILLSRPDQVVVRTRGDATRRSFYKDGRTITLIDDDHRVYAQIDDPGSIDEMMDMLWNEYGVATPLADLLSADPYHVFMSKAVSSRYLGVHDGDGVPSHHVVVVLPYLEYQAWVGEADGRLRKMIISYPDQLGEPQYEVHIVESRPVDTIDPQSFVAEIPEGYERIDLAPLVGAR